ncbi:MAG: methylmalonyl-CoA mutase family protein [Dehalococcoidia bacterium]|nr:MAG: methylmalonyl-CoA mutase family protein [Dehalococcoidia bacterium]
METSKSKQAWLENKLQPAIKKAPEREEQFLTTSGIEIDDIYTPDDHQDLDYNQALGYPGEFPFTRGVQPTMYRGRIWTMRQYSGFASAEATNQRYHFLLEQGQTGLSVAFDLPTQIGYDSDSPNAQGEVGKVGVPVSSLEDMETLFEGIPLGKVSTSMTINSTASVLLAMYIAVGKKQGVDPSTLNGTIQNDVLKEYIARGTYIFPPKPSMRLTTDIFHYCAQNLTQWNTISISGYHIREAGSTAAQEIAFTLADGITYVQAAIDAGLDVDKFAGRLSFFFAANTNLLEEVAKFRAARRLWAKIMKDRFQAKDPRSMMLRFHTQTCGHTLTAQQPDNNVIRTAIQALAAILGGTQSLHTNSRDEAYATPSEDAVTLALRTQQLLAYESGVADCIDPLGGSYFVEYLTDALEQKASDYLQHIDELGGALRAIEQGYPQREIQESSYRTQKDIEAGKKVVVGVNQFVSPYPEITGLLRVDAAEAEKQKQRLTSLRARRDNEKVDQSLNRLKEVASGEENTIPAIIDCVEAYATLGEICDVLRGVFGEQEEILVI